MFMVSSWDRQLSNIHGIFMGNYKVSLIFSLRPFYVLHIDHAQYILINILLKYDTVTLFFAENGHLEGVVLEVR